MQTSLHPLKFGERVICSNNPDIYGYWFHGHDFGYTNHFKSTMFYFEFFNPYCGIGSQSMSQKVKLSSEG